MPIYAYNCLKCGGHFEARRGVEDSSTPCPVCGTDAERAFCSGLPAVHGETVGRDVNSGAITKHGYMDMNLVQEAHAEVKREADKRGIEPPDYLQIAKERVASGAAGPSLIAK